MKVSAVIVTYNRLTLLKKCIKCLLNQTYKLNNIVVVNNNSTDGTKNYLESIHDKRIIVKNMTKNLGGAGGFSNGTKIAFEETDSDLFWIMDDDTMPKPTALKELVNSANNLHDKFGFLCSNVRWWKKDYPCNVPKADIHWSQLLPSNLIKIRIATFVSFMFSRNTVRHLGLPIAKMFIWGDDFEYSLRLSNYLPSYFVSNSIVIHDTKDFTPNPSFFNLPKKREKYLEYSFRNELYAIRKHEGKSKVIKKILSELFFIIRIPFLAKRDKINKLYYTISGLIKGLFFNPNIQFPK